MPHEGCVVCDRLLSGDLVAESPLAAAFPDAFPLSPGHTLIVPRRHESAFWALRETEKAALWELVGAVKHHVESRLSPHGYNLGMNIGEAAGQTVGHVHLHVIPRYRGDVPDARGGVRWIIPNRARYWEAR
jgi:diadenosine tetraphosphate (Ap4A) HIT family hydrolase